MNIDAYADKLAKRLMSGLEDNITDHLMDYLEDNLADIIHDAIIDEIRECLTQAVIEAKEEVKNEISVDKKVFIKDLGEYVRDLCKDKTCFIFLYGDKTGATVALEGSPSNLTTLLSTCIDSIAKHSTMTRIDILNNIWLTAVKMTK